MEIERLPNMIGRWEFLEMVDAASYAKEIADRSSFRIRE